MNTVINNGSGSGNGSFTIAAAEFNYSHNAIAHKIKVENQVSQAIPEQDRIKYVTFTQLGAPSVSAISPSTISIGNGETVTKNITITPSGAPHNFIIDPTWSINTGGSNGHPDGNTSFVHDDFNVTLSGDNIIVRYPRADREPYSTSYTIKLKDTTTGTQHEIEINLDSKRQTVSWNSGNFTVQNADSTEFWVSSQSWNATVVPSSGHVIDEITATMGGRSIPVQVVDYGANNSKRITLNNLTDDVYITITTIADKTVTFSGTNCTLTSGGSNGPWNVHYGGEFTGTFSIQSQFKISNIQVIDQSNNHVPYTYDASTRQITIQDITKNITISATGIAAQSLNVEPDSLYFEYYESGLTSAKPIVITSSVQPEVSVSGNSNNLFTVSSIAGSSASSGTLPVATSSLLNDGQTHQVIMNNLPAVDGSYPIVECGVGLATIVCPESPQTGVYYSSLDGTISVKNVNPETIVSQIQNNAASWLTSMGLQFDSPAYYEASINQMNPDSIAESAAANSYTVTVYPNAANSSSTDKTITLTFDTTQHGGTEYSNVTVVQRRSPEFKAVFVKTIEGIAISPNETVTAGLYGSSWSYTISPETNHYFDTVVVQMQSKNSNGTTSVSNITSTAYNPSTGVISVGNITGTIFVNTVEDINTYSITATGSHCTIGDGQNSWLVKHGSNWSANIVADLGYKIDNVVVKKDNVTQSGVYSNGAITLTNVTGNYTIQVTTSIDTDSNRLVLQGSDFNWNASSTSETLSCEVSTQFGSWSIVNANSDNNFTYSVNGNTITITAKRDNLSSTALSSTLTVRFNNNSNYDKSVTIQQRPLDYNFIASAANTSLTVGNTTNITASATSGTGTNGSVSLPTTSGHVTYSSSDTSVATVNGNGQITAIGVGNATITVTYKPDASSNANTKVVYINISVAAIQRTITFSVGPNVNGITNGYTKSVVNGSNYTTEQKVIAATGYTLNVVGGTLNNDGTITVSNVTSDVIVTITAIQAPFEVYHGSTRITTTDPLYAIEVASGNIDTQEFSVTSNCTWNVGVE